MALDAMGEIVAWLSPTLLSYSH
jgi:hypothetical protein